MSGFVAGEVLQTVVPDGLGPSLLVLLASGLVGMSIRQMIDIFGDGEDGDDADGVADGGLMAEDGDEDDLGGFGGLDEGDDEFGDFGGDEFDDMDEGADTDELEHRLDELETEVGSLSSTVNTVRNENEQISETVDDVEENVRKLLDIYEMVTRGVNPFADDIEAGGMGGMEDGSFGLFSDDDGGDEEEDIDEEIANADAEGFFDEDLVEDDADPQDDVSDVMSEESDDGFEDDGGTFEDDGGTFEDDVLDDAFDDDTLDDEFDDDTLDDDTLDDEFDDTLEDTEDMSNAAETDDSDEGGKSFAELKDEYESGDAEWAEEVDSGGDEPGGDRAGLDEADGVDPEMGEAEEALDDDDFADDELFDEVIEDDGLGDVEGGADGPDEIEGGAADPDDLEGGEAISSHARPDATVSESPEPMSEPEPEPEAEQSTTAAGSATAAAGRATGETAAGRPYLRTLPDGFEADLVVIEWLESLVGEVGVRETARAIDYYESIDWIAESVGEDLQDYLQGFDDDGEAASDGLTIDHHTRSLRYISQLDGDAAEGVALSMLDGHGGGLDGLQR